MTKFRQTSCSPEEMVDLQERCRVRFVNWCDRLRFHGMQQELAWTRRAQSLLLHWWISGIARETAQATIDGLRARARELKAAGAGHQRGEGKG